MENVKTTAISSALGAVVIGSLAGTPAVAETNPFGMQHLESGYMQVVSEGKCGGDKAKKEGKCGEGKCGEDKAAKAGKDGKDKATKEGKCGEGKCGGDKAAKEGKCGGVA
nr:hypothetical protein [Alteromonas lipotrueiana]